MGNGKERKIENVRSGAEGWQDEGLCSYGVYVDLMRSISRPIVAKTVCVLLQEDHQIRYSS